MPNQQPVDHIEQVQPKTDTLLGVGELLRNSWKLYKKRFSVLFGIVFFLSIISFLIGIGWESGVLVGRLFFYLIGVFFLIIGSWSQIALLYAIKDSDENIGVIESYRRGWHKLLSYWWVLLLVIFIIFGVLLFMFPGLSLGVMDLIDEHRGDLGQLSIRLSTLLFFLSLFFSSSSCIFFILLRWFGYFLFQAPLFSLWAIGDADVSFFVSVIFFPLGLILAFIFIIWFNFSPYVLISENLRGMNAIFKSREYVRGRGWRVFLRILASVVIVIVLLFLLLLALNFVDSLISIPDLVISYFLTPLFFLLPASFLAIYNFLLYDNLKSLRGEFVFVPEFKQKFVFFLSAIIGFLLIIGMWILPPLFQTEKRIRDHWRKADLSYISWRAEKFYDDYGIYPIGANYESVDFRGYLTEKPKDPLNKDEYVYIWRNNRTDNQRFIICATMEKPSTYYKKIFYITGPSTTEAGIYSGYADSCPTLETRVDCSNNICTTSLCKVDYNEFPTMGIFIKEVAKLCEDNYPKISQRLANDKLQPPYLIIFKKKLVDKAGEVRQSIINLSGGWFTAHPEDLGTIIHEMTHVVQNSSVDQPFWLIEGIADYIRYWLDYSTFLNYPHCEFGEHYTSGYECSAAFLRYVEKVYNKDIITKLNLALRENNYTDSLFKSFTGKTLEELWQECKEADCANAKRFWQ